MEAKESLDQIGLIVSIVVCFFTYVSIRGFLIQSLNDSAFQKVLEEAFIMFEMTLSFCGFIRVLEDFGMLAYLIILIITSNHFNLNHIAQGRPHKYIAELFGDEPNDGFGITLLIVITQALVSFLSFQFFEMIIPSINKDFKPIQLQCGFPDKIWFVYGGLAEGLGTFIIDSVNNILYLQREPYLPHITAVTQALLTIALFQYTGGFFNPALAFGTCYNCDSFKYIPHFTTYWAGPIVGSILAVFFANNPSVRRYFGV